MQVVIEISEERYNALCKRGVFVLESQLPSFLKALRNGTILPEGHGRLIDADVFWEMLNNMPINHEDKWFNWMQKESIRLASVPTIIPADKEM